MKRLPDGNDSKERGRSTEFIIGLSLLNWVKEFSLVNVRKKMVSDFLSHRDGKLFIPYLIYSETL